MTPRELAERAESATGPSRRMDLLIMRYLMNIGGAPENALRYTESVDDALTCLPKGWGYTGTVHPELDRHNWEVWHPLTGERGVATAATPASALIAAICRSRETADADT